MKYIEKQKDKNSNKKIYLFAVGKQEAQILLGLINKALTYAPKLKMTMTMEARMRAMGKVIFKAIPKIEPGTDKENFETF